MFGEMKTWKVENKKGYCNPQRSDCNLIEEKKMEMKRCLKFLKNVADKSNL